MIYLAGKSFDLLRAVSFTDRYRKRSKEPSKTFSGPSWEMR
jgi:hypothetical protein